MNLLGNIVFTWLADQGKYTFMGKLFIMIKIVIKITIKIVIVAGMFAFHTVVNFVATTFFIFSRLKLVPPPARS